MTEFEYFYEDEFKKLTCYSSYHFLGTVHKLLSEDNPVDIESTLNCVSKHIVLKDGSYRYFSSWFEMFIYLKEELALDLDLIKCFQTGQQFTLYFNSNPFKVESKEVNKTIELDMETINGFNDESDKKASKDAFETYAKEKYGIDLAKNKSFKNMVKQLEDELNK